MKITVSYCKSWFRAKKKPTEIWTAEQAKAAHLSKRIYTALIGPVEKPFCFLEINNKFVGVGFLDDKCRESLYYAFKEIEPGRLFLSMATYREFDDETDTVVLGTSYVFSPNGVVKIQKQHFKPHSVEVTENSVNVCGNYSSWPEFGEYDDLIRVERS